MTEQRSGVDVSQTLIRYESIREAIAGSFEMDDLELLCDDLKVEWDEIPGDTKSIKALGIIHYFQQRHTLNDLITKCAKERPNIDWEKFKAISQSPSADRPDRSGCVFPGLKAYGVADADIFFGRDDEVTDLTRYVNAGKQIFIVGPSGSGKSSLINAGLVPVLPQPKWRIKSMHPGIAPLLELARALNQTQLAQNADFHAIVVQVLAEEPAAERFLLIVDQAEELFTLEGRKTQPEFIASLQALSQVPGQSIIIALRADFYQEAIECHLFEMGNSQLVNIAPLDRSGLRKMLLRTADSAGVTIEDDLLERLLDDSAQEKACLPLLQEALQILWGRMDHDRITLSAYESLSIDNQRGLAGVLNKYADEAINGLAPSLVDMAGRILVDLVQIDEDDGSRRPVYTRRRRGLEDLRGLAAKDQQDDFDKTLEHLADQRLITISALEDKPDQVVVDLVHEALITCWPRLEQWLKVTQDSVRAHRRLTRAATLWQDTNKDRGTLYGGALLLEAVEFARKDLLRPLSDLECNFLVASARRENALQRSRYLGQAAGLALGAGLGFGAAIALIYGWDKFMLVNAADNAVALWIASYLRSTIVAFLAATVLGGLTGLCIGIGLWKAQAHAGQPSAAVALIGAVAGSATYLTYRLLTGQEGTVLADAFGGGLIGAGLGLGASLTLTGQKRWIDIPLCTLLAMLLAGTLTPMQRGASNPLVLIVAGLVFGAGAALGLQATAVESEPPEIIWPKERCTSDKHK